MLDDSCAVKMGVSSEESVVRSEGREKVNLVWVKQGDRVIPPSFGFLFLFLHSLKTTATRRMRQQKENRSPPSNTLSLFQQ